MRAALLMLALSGCAATELVCASGLPPWADEKERECAAEKAKRIENGPACTAYQRLIDNLAEKCSERPKRSFDEKAMPPLRGASE